MSHELVLVDTSAWLLALGRSYLPQAKERLEQLLGENRVAVAPMICLELLGGTRSTAEFNRLKSRLDALHQLPVGQKEWDKAAQMAFEWRRQGKTIPYTDILIGAVAILSEATLLHADRHFDIMAESTGVSVESLVSQVRNQ